MKRTYEVPSKKLYKPVCALTYLVALHHVLAVSAGTGKAKTYAEMPKTAWVRFANKIKPESTRDIQIHFDM